MKAGLAPSAPFGRTSLCFEITFEVEETLLTVLHKHVELFFETQGLLGRVGGECGVRPQVYGLTRAFCRFAFLSRFRALNGWLFDVLSRELISALVVDTKDSYPDSIVFPKEITHVPDIGVSDFRDMYQASLAALKAHDCTVFGKSYYCAFDSTTDFNRHSRVGHSRRSPRRHSAPKPPILQYSVYRQEFGLSTEFTPNQFSGFQCIMQLLQFGLRLEYLLCYNHSGRRDDGL